MLLQTLRKILGHLRPKATNRFITLAVPFENQPALDVFHAILDTHILMKLKVYADETSVPFPTPVLYQLDALVPDEPANSIGTYSDFDNLRVYLNFLLEGHRVAHSAWLLHHSLEMEHQAIRDLLRVLPDSPHARLQITFYL
jgi:hypothetical protein